MRPRPIGDFAVRVQGWIEENTALDPARARQRVLDMMLWLEKELEHPSHEGRTLEELLRLTRAIGCGSEKWLRGRSIRISGTRFGPYRPKTLEELRGYRIGKSQTRDGRRGATRWWYAIPPEPVGSVEALDL